MKRLFLPGPVSLVALMIFTGCGDTYRPIIIPNPPTFPNPAAAHTVVSISDNAPPQGQNEVAAGSAMVIDVAGDADVSEVNVGLAPVHAVQQTANQVLVVNHSVSGMQDDSLTRLVFNGTVISSTQTVSLPPNSFPNFVAVAPTDTTAYVSLPNVFLDPVNHPGNASIGVVNTNSNLLASEVSVGNNPVALAVTPDKSKLYVANEGDGTITAFNVVVSGNSTVNLSQRNGSPVSTSSAPIWLTARTDNQQVYVLESSGALEWLDTTATAGPDVLHATTVSVPGAKTMTYDSNKNRLYIPGGPIMTIVDVATSSPQPIATITIPNIPGLPNPVAASAVAVTALPDGTRAYVASVPSAAQPSQVNISAVQGDGTTATYTYTWTGGHDLTPGITIVVSGIAKPNDVFNGTYLIDAVFGSSCNLPSQVCTFQAANSNKLPNQTAVTGAAASAIDNLFPQVSVVSVNSNAITKTIGIPGFPDATVSGSQYYSSACVAPVPPVPYRATFRFMMAAAGSSTRAYLSSCDGGNVNFIDTSNDSYIMNLPAPIGTRQTIPPGPLNLPQNPVFLIAGP